MEQFTASEVRDYLFSIEERSSRQWLIAHDAELGMLRQFADLLEAQEKAVPVVTRESAINALAYVGQYNGPGRETEARQMLVEGSPSVAHHAQAQPPAARVTDAMIVRLKHALPLFCADVTMADARAALEAALAAQENPNG